MVSKQIVSREIIFLFLLLIGLWTHSTILLKIRGDITKNDCTFNPNDLFIGVIVLEIIGNCSLSISFILASSLLHSSIANNQEIRDDEMINITFFKSLSFTLFFVCSILTNVTFFKSSYVEGNLTTCSNNDAEFAYRIITFSFAWILFIFYIFFAFGLIMSFLVTIGIAIKESNLFNCIDCSNIFSSFKRVTPINISPNDKNIQTENEVSIPITSLKNDIKPFICMICMTNMIDVIIRPCNHICMCNDCIKKLSKNDCPCCNKKIAEVNNIFIQNLS